MPLELPVAAPAAPVPDMLRPERAPARAAVAFRDTLAAGGRTLRAADAVTTLQVNVGKLCNQACKHCHVEAGPKRTEIMSPATAEQVIAAVERFGVPIVDITGGAPEMCPSFRRLVTGSRDAGAHVIARHNLTVQFEPGHADLPAFFAENQVEVVCSLPYFQAQQTDAQRGQGVFDGSIEALRRLNAAGYGIPGRGLTLNLVYNPAGAFLPAAQDALEADFRRELRARFGLEFDHLFTITNMPIRRFLDYLRRTRNEERYMRRLLDAYNPATVDAVMCRALVSVDWTGRLFDCDFNQMLDLPLLPGLPQTIADFDPSLLAGRPICTGDHCYGCTAGAGSSCGGAVA